MKAGADGFTLVEALVAALVSLVILGATFPLVASSQAAFRGEPARAELRQRVSAARDILSRDIWRAGEGPVGGLMGGSIGSLVAVVIPHRVGLRGADAPGTRRSELVTLVRAVEGAAAATVVQPVAAAAATALVEPGPPCPVAVDACGLEAGMSVLLVDGRGQSDLLGVTAVSGNSVRLQPRGAVSGRTYPAGSRLVSVSIATYYLRAATDTDARQLARYDGNQSDLPLVDHVVSMAVELYGEAEPPRLRLSRQPGEPVMTYGPAPPPPGEDHVEDAWGAGENCIVSLVAGAQVPRLARLSGGEADLVQLSDAVLGDGPWCPDSSHPARYDADLLRVRSVRVRLRLEALDAAVRAAVGGLFARPGHARDPRLFTQDEEMSFETVPRSLGGAR